MLAGLAFAECYLYGRARGLGRVAEAHQQAASDPASRKLKVIIQAIALIINIHTHYLARLKRLTVKGEYPCFLGVGIVLQVRTGRASGLPQYVLRSGVEQRNRKIHDFTASAPDGRVKCYPRQRGRQQAR